MQPFFTLKTIVCYCWLECFDGHMNDIAKDNVQTFVAIKTKCLSVTQV